MDNSPATPSPPVATPSPPSPPSAAAPIPSEPAAVAVVGQPAGSEGTANECTGNDSTPKAGAPRLNANRQRHGLRSDPEITAARFALGGLAPSMRRIERDARRFRAVLEQAVMETHGSISISQALAISTAARWERHAALALRWLRESPEKLSVGERLSLSKAICDASTARDRAITALALGAKVDPWDELDRIRAREAIEAASRPPAPPKAPAVGQSASNARDAKPEALPLDSAADDGAKIPLLPTEGYFA